MYLVIGEDNFPKEIADKLNAEFVRINSFVFPDSEIKPVIENENNVRGKKVLVVIRTTRFKPSINDCIMKIYFTCKLLRELEVGEINLFLPYMFYSRQDKKFLPGEPESFSDIAKLYEYLGVSNIFTVNSHLYGKETPLQNYFKKIKIHDLSPAKFFAEYLKTKNLKNPIIIGPGKGANELIQELASFLGAEFEGLKKERDHKTQAIIMKPPKSSLKNRDVIIYDDVSASGGTPAEAFRLVYESKPNRIFISLVHLITKGGIEKLYKLNSTEIVTTDSFNSEEPIKFTEVSLIPLIISYLE
jgi:ribose-phosphate pyrophosphokinase